MTSSLLNSILREELSQNSSDASCMRKFRLGTQPQHHDGCDRKCLVPPEHDLLGALLQLKVLPAALRMIQRSAKPNRDRLKFNIFTVIDADHLHHTLLMASAPESEELLLEHELIIYQFPGLKYCSVRPNRLSVILAATEIETNRDRYIKEWDTELKVSVGKVLYFGILHEFNRVTADDIAAADAQVL
jgi:hypothetical protein